MCRAALFHLKPNDTNKNKSKTACRVELFIQTTQLALTQFNTEVATHSHLEQQHTPGALQTECVCASRQQAHVFLSVVVRVSLEGQMWRVVTDSHQEDDDGAKDHHRGNQEETESVHSASDPAPVIFLLQAQQR